LIAGAVNRIGIAFSLVVSICGHSLIGHKEARFLWPCVPFLFLFLSLGLENIATGVSPGFRRKALIAGFASILAFAAYTRLKAIEWDKEPSRSGSMAMAAVSRRSDLTGVAVYGLPRWECGNYFYLRKSVPLLVRDQPELGSLKKEISEIDDTINYLVTRPENISQFKEWNPEAVEVVHELVVCRLSRTPQSR
jgi:hypothetical protein